jgi:hypothetical protein
MKITMLYFDTISKWLKESGDKLEEADAIEDNDNRVKYGDNNEHTCSLSDMFYAQHLGGFDETTDNARKLKDAFFKALYEAKRKATLEKYRLNILLAAYERNGDGGYINTDGYWAGTRTPEELAALIEKIGFKVESAVSTATCTALITTAEGFEMSWNGYVRKLKQ